MKKEKINEILIIILFFLFIIEKTLTAYNSKKIFCKIIYSNGKEYKGKLIGRNKYIYFFDLFKRKYIKVYLYQIYKIKNYLIQEKILNKSKKKERNFIMCINTWSKVRYWGKFNLRITLLIKNNYKKRFYIFKTQHIYYKNSTFPYIKEIFIYKKNKKIDPNFQKSFPYLTGIIKPLKKFEKIYLIHQKYNIIFISKIRKKGEYNIYDIMPGYYDTILVGKDIILFHFSIPPRKNFFDRKIYLEYQQDSISLNKLLKQNKKKLIYIKGVLSNTKALVFSKDIINKEEIYSIYLWILTTKNNKFYLNKEILIDKYIKSLPYFFIEPKIRDIYIPKFPLKNKIIFNYNGNK